MVAITQIRLRFISSPPFNMDRFGNPPLPSPPSVPISLSSGAIQNKRENINEIKKTYEQFFNQSQSLIYHLKNPRIEILPDHAQVKASYEIRQVLKTGDTLLWKGNIEWALIREGGELKISSIQYQHDRSP